MEVLTDLNRIKVGIVLGLVLYSITCAMQELKHLRMVGKKDIAYPDNFLGGLKVLVKAVLDEYAKQFGEHESLRKPRLTDWNECRSIWKRGWAGLVLISSSLRRWVGFLVLVRCLLVFVRRLDGCR